MGPDWSDFGYVLPGESQAAVISLAPFVSVSVVVTVYTVTMMVLHSMATETLTIDASEQLIRGYRSFLARFLPICGC